MIQGKIQLATVLAFGLLLVGCQDDAKPKAAQPASGAKSTTHSVAVSVGLTMDENGKAIPSKMVVTTDGANPQTFEFGSAQSSAPSSQTSSSN
jgi:hypothetical protein